MNLEMFCARRLRCSSSIQIRWISCGPVNLGRRVPSLEEDVQVYDYGKPQTDKKRLYVFGCPLHGALGLSTLLRPNEGQRKMEYIQRPIRHDIGGRLNLTHVAAGHGFTLVAVNPRNETDTTFLFGSGLNTHSQLGHQAARVGAPLEVLIGFVPIHVPIRKKSKILGIGAGRAHSIVSLEGEGLLSFGDNSLGQCGRPIIQNEAYFGSKLIHKIPKFGNSSEDEVVSVIPRYDVTYCITRGGRVFSFGANFKGQLGRGRLVLKPWEPQPVTGGDLSGQKIVKLSSCGSSTMAVNSEGELFSWGCNEMGHINPYDQGRVFYEPKHVKLSSSIGKIIDVAVGETFSFVVNEKGNVYVWGQGSCLGLGPSNVVVKFPTIIPPPLFGRNEFNPLSSVKSIVTSFFYAAAITSDGGMYSWGKNGNGCLGIGPIDHQYFPFKVILSGNVDKISLGVDHTLVLSRGGL